MPSESDEPSRQRPHAWIRRTDQVVLATLTAAACGALALYLVLRSGGCGSTLIDIDRAVPRTIAFRVDVNAAPWTELSQLPGIGETLAHRIVEYREANGPFADIDQLTEVSGIGPAKLEGVRPFVFVRPEAVP